MAIAASLTYFTVGLTLWAILVLPVLGLLFALPCLALVLLPLSWRLDPAGAGNPEKYFSFNDKAFERKWRSQRVPIEELYEAYFDEKIDLIDGDAALLDVIYQRHEFARSILTLSHVKFFLLQFIPELLKHTRFQDITQVREHYDRSVQNTLRHVLHDAHTSFLPFFSSELRKISLFLNFFPFFFPSPHFSNTLPFPFSVFLKSNLSNSATGMSRRDFLVAPLYETHSLLHKKKESLSFRNRPSPYLCHEELRGSCR